ncbi:MAG: beta-N-acetylhexosaminidase [Oligoflexus sp.]|jgi:beta-N-acetylhexosaminidase
MHPNQVGAVVLAALEGVDLSPEERTCFEQVPPAGFTLFRRNLSSSYHRILQLCRSIQALSSTPLIIAIDQEGGRVARLRSPFPDQGPALGLMQGSADAEALLAIENYAFVVGASLLRLGVNVDFAPVLDILTREDNLSIGDRCFGRDPETVVLRAGAFLRGLQGAGVWGCLKHFPGQGDAGFDTHESGARIDADRALLQSRELLPFARLMPECPMIMISHATYPALDAERPASLSPKIMQTLIREQLHYRGLIVSDDMNMKAIDQSREPWCAAIIAAVAAGVDLILVCRELDRYRWAVEALSREAQRSPAFYRRLEEALQRVHALRSRLNSPMS